MKTPFGNMAAPSQPSAVGAIVQPLPRPPRSAELADKFEAICATCKWNVDWICEHVACRPCKQRAAGGLKLYLRLSSFWCPAHKW